MMQLGTRWMAGTTPPSAVPAEIHPAIADVENSADAAELSGAWTLTWLEGRPIAELDLGFEVALAADGTVQVSEFDED